MTFSRPIKRLTAFTACACALIGATQIASSSADLSSQIANNKAAAQSLQSQINAESSQIQKTAGGLAIAQQRYSAIESHLQESVNELKNVQTRLMTARDDV